MSHEISLEDQLRSLRSLLENLETKQATQEARWEHTLAFTPPEKKPGMEEMINKQRARNNHEKNILKQRISNIKEQIVRQAEETRVREERRAWLMPEKAKALESWLSSGGTEKGFEDSWPEMERQILMRDTLESLDAPPITKRGESADKQPGTKRNWNSKWDKNLKSPPDPKKKKQ